jgi:hypothetical protein
MYRVRSEFPGHARLAPQRRLMELLRSIRRNHRKPIMLQYFLKDVLERNKEILNHLRRLTNHRAA